MSTEDEDAKVRRDLKSLGAHIDKHYAPYGWGFVVLMFPFEQGGRMNYVANAKRADVVRAMYEFIESTRDRFGQHIAEEGAVAEDERLARVQHQLAELRGLIKKSLIWIEESGEATARDSEFIHQLKDVIE